MGRIFASGDWHGNGELAKQVLKFLKEDDILYFIGDCCDRGPDGVEIFQLLINDPRIFFLKGNHEDMMAKAILALYEDWAYDSNITSHWYNNGGIKTANSFRDMTKEEVFAIREAILQMPTEAIYKSPAGHTVIMEHAGYTPFDIPHRSHDPLWDRKHFHDNWAGGDNFYLVHGHTPVQYLKFEYGYNGDHRLTIEEMKERKAWMKNGECITKPTIIRYCNGHKFDIDMCTIVSNRIALLDLDTFEEIYFDGEEE